MNDTSIVAWIALAIAVSLAPGPDVLLVFGHATRRGRRAGLLAALGITTGGLWYVALCGFGFLSILAMSPKLFIIAKLLGALYLAWLGVKLIMAAARHTPHDSAAPPDLGAPFRQGLFANVLNPKVALFYLAVLPQFTGTSVNAPLHGVLLIAIHYALNLPWLALVAVSGARAGAAVRNGPAMRWIEGLLGTLLLGLAGRLAVAKP